MVSNDSKSNTSGSLFFQPSGSDWYSLKKSIELQAVSTAIADKATILKNVLLLFITIGVFVWFVSVIFVWSSKILFIVVFRVIFLCRLVSWHGLLRLFRWICICGFWLIISLRFSRCFLFSWYRII